MLIVISTSGVFVNFNISICVGIISVTVDRGSEIIGVVDGLVTGVINGIGSGVAFSVHPDTKNEKIITNKILFSGNNELGYREWNLNIVFPKKT